MAKEKKSGKQYKPKRDAKGKFISARPNANDELITKGEVKILMESGIKDKELVLYFAMMFWIFAMTVLIFTFK